MASNDPVTEWRKRWQPSGVAPVARPARPPRSPWVYALAAFGGTIAAMVCFTVSCFGILIAIGLSQDDYDVPDGNIGYRNDTEDAVWVYECADRCETVLYSFYLNPDDWTYFPLTWYDENPVDWVVVVGEDRTYGCINMELREEELIDISTAAPCPSDIHSPENDVM